MARSKSRAAGVERRDFRDSPPAIADDGTITGLAAPFNSQTMIGRAPWGFREKISPGAFTKALQEGDCVYLDNHDTGKPVARQSAGTLTLSETARGLEYVATPAKTTYGKDLVLNIKAGNIRGNSFGFEAINEIWAVGTDGVDERTLTEVKLPEISACTFPAYADTDIGVREQRDRCQAVREAYAERMGIVAPAADARPPGEPTATARAVASVYEALDAETRLALPESLCLAVDQLSRDIRATAGKPAGDDDADDGEPAPCETCDGTGKIKGNTTKCPDCHGTGNAPADPDRSKPKPDTSTLANDVTSASALRRRIVMAQPRN